MEQSEMKERYRHWKTWAGHHFYIRLTINSRLLISLYNLKALRLKLGVDITWNKSYKWVTLHLPQLYLSFFPHHKYQLD